MKTVIIDGNNFGWRGSVTPLIHEGSRTEVVHTGIGMMRKYVESMKPDRLVVVWDGGRDKTRTELFPEYKRKGKELTKQQIEDRHVCFAQMECLRYVFGVMGIEQYRLKGREADDVIFSIVKTVAEHNDEIVVVSTDKDMYQLLEVSSCVKIYSPTKELWVDREVFAKEYGFDCSLYVYYRAMTGDSSDNLPGVNGIGPVKAKKLIAEHLADGYGCLTVDIAPENMLIASHLDGKSRDTFYKMEKLIRFISVPIDEIIAGSCWRHSYWDNDVVIASFLGYGMHRHVDAIMDIKNLFERYSGVRIWPGILFKSM